MYCCRTSYISRLESGKGQEMQEMQEMSELKQYVRQLYRHNADQLWREIISYADLGTMEDMKNVVHEAQRLGIRLIMDLVSNHVS